MKRFRQRLRDGETVFGQMVLELFTPGLGPILAAAGMDFVIYDMEHGRCDITLAAEMIASCRGSDLFPIVRVPDPAFHPLSRLLDIGARGVMVPRVAAWPDADALICVAARIASIGVKPQCSTSSAISACTCGIAFRSGLFLASSGRPSLSVPASISTPCSCASLVTA